MFKSFQSSIFQCQYPHLPYITGHRTRMQNDTRYSYQRRVLRLVVGHTWYLSIFLKTSEVKTLSRVRNSIYVEMGRYTVLVICQSIEQELWGVDNNIIFIRVCFTAHITTHCAPNQEFIHILRALNSTLLIFNQYCTLPKQAL